MTSWFRSSWISSLLTLGWALCLLACSGTVLAQERADATLGFSCDFPGSDPEHYSISIHSDGNSSYTSDGKLNRQSEAVPLHLDFQVSQPTRNRIFELAKRSGYFAGKIDSGKKSLASSGVKTLTYSGPQGNTQASYNYSPNAAVQELTTILQNLSVTLEFGLRLAFEDRFQKLALDAELKNMEEMSQRNNLEEIGAVAPILRTISQEPALLNMVRARAQRLLAAADLK